MSSDVVLTAALRSNLLSLQNTQSLIDRTQLRLATGLRVNSALDSPQNFFTSQSLDNRAGDLSRLLDGIALSIRTIETADNGITALTSLVENAQSIVSSARDELAASEGEARAVGTVDLSDVADITTLDPGIAAGDNFRIFTTDDSGAQISEEITIAAGTAASLAAQITDAFADNQNGEITATITDEGFLSIQSSDGRSFRIVDGDVAGPGATPITLAGFAALGLDRFFEDEARSAGAGTNLASTTIVAGNTVESISLFEGVGDLVEAGDTIANVAGYTDSDGNVALQVDAATTIQLVVNDAAGTSTVAVTGAATFQDLVDSVNQNANVNQLISANFDSGTGTISFTSLADSVENIQIVIDDNAAGETFNIGLGDPSGNLDPITTNGGPDDVVISFNSSTQALDSLAADYNVLREQIDRLVVDASFRGVNLLNGDDLTTFFNEDNSSSLITNGVTFTANGLGITEASFRSSTEIELSAVQARDALNSVRSFGSSLANNLSIIQTRQTFTQQTINTLTSGSDDLTVADQNEEGANLLALQTRQQLGVTSLSLAAQSQQSVLALF